MTESISKVNRRIGIVINYLCLFGVVVFFHIGKSEGWNIVIISVIILFLIGLLISFWINYTKTGLWKMIHSKSESLDERQIQVMHSALKYSYSAFAIITLGCMYYFVIFEGKQINVVLVTGLLYLAHILPASIIAWNERQV